MTEAAFDKAMDRIVAKCHMTNAPMTREAREMWTDLILRWKDAEALEAVRLLVEDTIGRPDPAVLKALYRDLAGIQSVPARFQIGVMPPDDAEAVPCPPEVKRVFDELVRKWTSTDPNNPEVRQRIEDELREFRRRKGISLEPPPNWIEK